MKRQTHLQRGDTLVEVLLATVVIAMVITGAFALTNRATRGNQAAIERTTVANLMREQAELVRGIRNTGTDSGSWLAIEAKAASGAPDYTDPNWEAPTNPGFYIDPAATDLFDPAVVKDYNPAPPECPPNSVDAHPSDIFCIWVEAHNADATDEYLDIHVRAYWDGIGDVGPQRESLIMRLQYDE